MGKTIPENSLQFLSGPDEMSKLIREKDWSQSVLGSPEFWPQCLRTTLSLLLNSKFPMFLWWGKELNCFYNDSYRPSLGNNGKHPHILGLNAEEAWSEIWHIIKPMIDQVLSAGESTWSENQLIPIFRNGEVENVYWTFSYSPVRNDNYAIEGVLVTCIETTVAVESIKRMEESEDRFRIMADHSEILIAVADETSNATYFNNAWEKLTGRPMADLLKFGWVDLIHPEDKDEFLNSYLAAFEKRIPFTGQFRVLNKNREYRSLLAKGPPRFRSDGSFAGYISSCFDITNLYLAKEKIKLSEQRFQAAVKAVEGILWTNNAEGKMEGEQLGWSALTGQDYQEYQGFGWANAVHPEDSTPTIDAWNEAVRERKTFVFEHRVKLIDGSWGDFSVRAIPIFNDDGALREWVGVHTNITDFKLSQKKLKENKEKLNIVIDASELGTFELNLIKDEIYCSDRFQTIFGITKGEKLTHADYLNRLHQGDLATRNNAFVKAIDTGLLQYQARIVWADHSIHWIEVKGKIFFNESQVPEMLIGTCRDITLAKTSQHELEESEQKFRLLSNSMPQFIWTSDPEGNLNYFNQSVYDYSGLSNDQIATDGWLQIVHPDDREKNIEMWENAITSGKNFLFEHRFRRYDGVYRWQLSRAIPQKDENGNIQMWVGTSTDIEDQKTFSAELEKQVLERTNELEQKNLELEKMNKELKSFAYISSHDLQEPLRKIQTFSTRLMQKEYDNLSDNGKEQFERMQKAAERMQTLIDDLLAYSRTNTAERNYEFIHLRKIIDEVKSDLKEELQQSHATIEMNEMCEINIIRFQFRQLMHNLISNSLKFANPLVPPHIVINCKIENSEMLDFKERVPNIEYCHIRIADNGIGFDQQYSERIFELFQRLHGRSQYTGTGIGLAIVKKIVENHNGIITSTSQLNMGATFDIYLPVT